MYDKYNALVKNGTWSLVPRPSSVNMVCSMWLFKHKFHTNGTLSRYKARLVANGSSQQLGVDFDHTCSLVVKPATIRTVLCFVVSRYATRTGFYHSRCDSSLFIYRQGSQVVYLLVYVDDIILTTPSIALLQHLIDSLHFEFDMTELEVFNYFLGHRYSLWGQVGCGEVRTRKALVQGIDTRVEMMVSWTCMEIGFHQR
nr:putative reverse transcriptase [Tanacetum cinerariifolium]